MVRTPVSLTALAAAVGSRQKRGFGSGTPTAGRFGNVSRRSSATS